MKTLIAAVDLHRLDTSSTQAVQQRADRLLSPRKRRRAIVMPLFIISFVFYIGTLVVLSYGPKVVAQQVSGSLNVAYLLALPQFVSTFLVAILYAVPAKKLLDPVTNIMESELIKGAAR